MRRRGRRAILLFGAYAALLLAVVVAGFIGQAVGVWAAAVWGVAVIAGLILFGRRLHRPQVDP
jgi:predicted MFS family arabinose efflux permease